MLEAVQEVLRPRAQARLVRAPVVFDEVADVAPNDIPLEAARLVADSARFLELLVAVSAITEVVHELHVTTIATAIARRDEIVAQASARARLDVVRAIAHHQHVPPSLPDLNEAPTAPLDSTRRQIDAVLLSCPIHQLEALGKRVECVAEAHRCRSAFDWLTAFVTRHKVSDRVIGLIGRAYAEARLSVDEVAAALQMHPTDAMASLEQHGYARTHSTAVLSEEQRRPMLEALRADRLRRAGRPEIDDELIQRDVVASERIEGVDARRWTSSS